MYILKNEDYSVIPLAFCDFCDDISRLGSLPKYAGKVSIDRVIDVELFCEIVEFCKNNEDMLVIIDMLNVISCGNRVCKCLLEINNPNIIIVNIHSSLIEIVKEDLKDEYYKIDSNTLCPREELGEKYFTIKNDIKDIYHHEMVTIVQNLKQSVNKDDVEKIQPLESSGIYCNMYINVKNLFFDSDKLMFVIYQMICMIEKDEQDFDALVSASRNGANLACIIGLLLEKKVVYCANLGPRFSLAPKMIDKEIREDKKYVYIFDFLCLGTEAKLLNALLKAYGASLVKGYGIANYISVGDKQQQNVLRKMRSLVDVKEEQLGYKIAGSIDEIKEMLVEENKYDSGLFKV